MTNPELQTVTVSGQKYKQELASELAQRSCPGCVADNNPSLCSDLWALYGCYDAEERELIWLKVE